MASLFYPKPPSSQVRIVSHGGLGGFVCPGENERDRTAMADDWMQTEGKRRRQRQRPPPIQVQTTLLTTSFTSPSTSQLSVNSETGYPRPWTPITPTDRLRSESLLESEANASLSAATTTCSLLSRYNSSTPLNACFSPPQTPAPVPSLPAELPGSLLLASQGFPQTDPISPPPSFHRRDTGDSMVSSPRALSVSSTAYEADMDTIRHLAHPLRKNDRNSDLGEMPSYVIGSQLAPDQAQSQAQIAKPFTAMNLDELLKCFPHLDSSTISELWFPALHAQLQHVTSLAEEVSEYKLEAMLQEKANNHDLSALARDIRVITSTYRNVLQMAESLMERDSQAQSTRVKDLEVQVEEAADKLEAKDDEITDQNLKIRQLRQTILDIVRILGAFLQANIPGWARLAQNPETEEVFRVFSDYSRSGDSGTLRFVRIPEITIDKYAVDIKEAKALVTEYRKLLQSQSDTIQKQSSDLDASVEKFAKVVQRMKERDHEILLVVQTNEDLVKRLEQCEEALAQTRKEKAESVQRCQELKGKMKSLEIAQTLELDQRDAQIVDLRQKLGSAREEIFARRADVRNILSQTHPHSQNQIPMINVRTPSSSTKISSSTSKALRFLGMGQDRDKLRKPGLPGSRSMIGLSPTSLNFPTSALDSRYSSKEVAPPISKPSLRPASPYDNYGRVKQGREISVNGPGDLILPGPLSVRPRDTSLGATKRHGVLPTESDKEKSLPTPPRLSLPLSNYFDRDSAATGCEAVYSPMAEEIASNYENGIYGQTGPRRVLSKIPEGSNRGSSEGGDALVEDDAHDYGYCQDDVDSVASSDREVYRKSIHVLDLLNSSKLPHSDTENDLHRQERRLGQEGETTHYGEDEQHEDLENGINRLLQLRPQPANGNLRSAWPPTDGEPNVNEGATAIVVAKTRARESVASDADGYRSSDSDVVPKTVAQLYHQQPRHIRT